MSQDSVNVDRWKYVGGSDVAAIMNLSSFKTRFQLLQEKAQIREDIFEGNKYTSYGNTMEPKIRDFLSSKFGQFDEGRHYCKIGEIDCRLHTDGENIAKKTILEIKTTSHIYKTVGEYKAYLVQLLFYMRMLNCPKGILAVYSRPEDMSEEFDPKRLQVFKIRLSDYLDLLDEITAAIQLFYQDLLKLRENPFLTQEDLIPEDVSSLAKRYSELKEQEDKLEEVKKERKMIGEKLCSAIYATGNKTFDAYGFKFTAIPGEAASTEKVFEFDADSFEKDHPRLFKKYLREIEKKSNGRKDSVKLTRLSNEN